jgi:hypothetical protein
MLLEYEWGIERSFCGNPVDKNQRQLMTSALIGIKDISTETGRKYQPVRSFGITA